MTQHVLDLVTAYQDAWTSGDLDTAATFLAPDFRFEGAGASFTSADEFLPFLARFGARIGPGWRQVAAFGDGDEALVMYELRGPAGQALPLTVDHFVVRDGLIAAETLVFDTAAFGQAMAGAAAAR
jgi:ketosteroid isomerase-like protein